MFGRPVEFQQALIEEHVVLAAEVDQVVGLPAPAVAMRDEVRMIELASPLRGIGKMGVSDAILLKPGKLDAAEFEEIKKHPRLGYDILSGSSSKFVQVGASIALHHHERWDGSGYPDGLAGEDIPLPARIVAVTDVLEALTTDRPYREALPMAKALDYLKSQSGQQFDPAVIDALMARRERIQEIFDLHAPAPLSR